MSGGARVPNGQGNTESNQRRQPFLNDMKAEPCIQCFTLLQLANKQHIYDGNNATIYTAEAPCFGKVILKKFTKSVAAKYEFRELTAIMKLSYHPNTVTFYGVVIDDTPGEGLFRGLIMEYMEGGCLGDRSFQKSMAIPLFLSLNAVSWSTQACRALSFLHQHKVLHRDVKPANMMLTGDRRILKLGDFGLATDQRDRMTCSVGTVRYMAPEVLMRGRDGKTSYDHKCDTYSMAITLHEIITRRFAYEDVKNVQLLGNIVVSGERPVFDPQAGGISDRCSVISNECWKTNPADRKDMEWMRQQLEELLKWVNGQPL